MTAAHAPTATRVLAVPHVPTISIATADLWAKLESHRLGEDGRVSIECNRERRRNLEGDYPTPVAAPIARAAHTPSALGGTGDAWRLLHISAWWSGRACFGPTYLRSMMGLSTPLSSCRSTPPPSLLQEAMRMSWPTTSP
jgi:hypothetical protein